MTTSWPKEICKLNSCAHPNGSFNKQKESLIGIIFGSWEWWELVGKWFRVDVQSDHRRPLSTGLCSSVANSKFYAVIHVGRVPVKEDNTICRVHYRFCFVCMPENPGFWRLLP